MLSSLALASVLNRYLSPEPESWLTESGPHFGVSFISGVFANIFLREPLTEATGRLKNNQL